MDDKSFDNDGVNSSDPSSIKPDILLPIVQSAYSEQIIQIHNWTCVQLGGGIGGGTIFRFAGQEEVSEKVIDWSVILKILKPSGNNIHITDWNYYKREADAYHSGWLDNLPEGIAAPRCLDVAEFPDGTCWIWLEDIRDSIEQWTIEDYGHVARDIGQFNGAYLTAVALPQQPWLSSHWIRGYISLSAQAMEPLHNSLNHPLVGRWYPGSTGDDLFRLWNQREAYLNVMDRLPQTICHFDFFRRNLFLKNTANPGNRTVAIDWAFVGHGCIGADISPLVIASLGFFEVGLDKARELDQIVFTEYLEGLRQAGWQGDQRKARLGYLIANMRYSFGQIGDWLSGVFDDNVRNIIEGAFGHPLGEIFDYLAMLNKTISFLEDERSHLMNELNYG
jgi:hypothetical protein